MGEAFLNITDQLILVKSHFILYGEAASESLAEQMADEVNFLWNEPLVEVNLKGKAFRVRFHITAAYHPHLSAQEVQENENPQNNFFYIGHFAKGNISYVDGLGSNTGYFLYDNLINHSTTAAHEYGHTIGLPHPAMMDLRGQGAPGIMYPRGTLVDAPFQYDPAVQAGNKGGTMHPRYRRVWRSEVALLRLQEYNYASGSAIIGGFTNIFHTIERKNL